MGSFLIISSTLVVGYLSTFLYCFIRNFYNAKKTGLPSVVVPWDQNHFIWMVASVPLRPWLRKNLPKTVWDRIALTIYGFEFHEKLRPFEEYAGPRGDDKTYMLVTCGSTEFWTRDAEIASHILSRPSDFTVHRFTALFMGKFGHNLLTSHGDRWARQRKIIAGVINERISKAVFNESIRQTQGLLSEVNETAKNGVAETNKLFDMAKKITIHVLSGAGMGASVGWRDEMTEQPKPGYKQTYIQSVKTVIEAVTGAIILPQWFLQNYPTFLPGYQYMKTLGIAVEEFPVHTSEMLEEERQRSQEAGGKGATNNIMSQLIQASKHSAQADEKGVNGNALSDEELLGNLFVFTAAGFDTTANTISYALVLLARYPQWQDWLLDEIDRILPPGPSEEMDYVSVFPRATRVMAFMLETLRLFPPLIHISRETHTSQTFQTSQGTYWLPADTTVYVNIVALHLDPKVWQNLNVSEKETVAKDDASHFRPSRWINSPGSPQSLFQPPKGAFISWSGGPRVCPGQKMAQVEFVAIFLTLLREYRIDAVPLGGESRAEVDKRLDERMRDSMSLLTLQMNGVYDVSDSAQKGLSLRVSKRN